MTVRHGVAPGSPVSATPGRGDQLAGYSVSRDGQTDADRRLREEVPHVGQSNLRRDHWSLDHIPAAFWPLRRTR